MSAIKEFLMTEAWDLIESVPDYTDREEFVYDAGYWPWMYDVLGISHDGFRVDLTEEDEKRLDDLLGWLWDNAWEML